MKLNESKESLPVAFLTSFVSDGWNAVGILKAQIEAIKKEFKDTTKVESIIQDLIDNYLICIGRMEAFLDKKDYLDIPSEEQLKEDLVIEIKTPEPIATSDVTIVTPVESEPDVADIKLPDDGLDDPIPAGASSTVVTTSEPIVNKPANDTLVKKDLGEGPKIKSSDYYLDDFPDPVGVSDADLYDDDGKVRA